MRALRALVLRVINLWSRDRRAREFAEELEAHVQVHIDEQIRAGLTPEASRRDALLKLGGLQQTTEAWRDRRRVPALDTILRESRYAWRSLRKSPGFTVVAILTLALGLGATTTMFSIVDGVLLKPLPYSEPDRLYVGRVTAPPLAHIAPSFPISAEFFHLWRTQCRSCEQVALVEGFGFTLSGHGDPERLPGLRTSYNFFQTLGVQPSLGRDFRPEEELPGQAHVVILSDPLWRSRFHADPTIIGQYLAIDGQRDEVIGVMPADLHLPRGEQWGPLFAHDRVPLIFRPLGVDVRHARESDKFNYSSLVRLRPEVTAPQAVAEMSADLAETLRELQLDQMVAVLIPLQSQVTGGARSALWLLLGSVGAVLLMVCVNVGNLMLVRAASRQREASLRLALGASRAGLFGLVLHEVLILVVVGGVLGVAFADLGVTLLAATASIDVPRIADVRIDWRVLMFAATAAGGATLVCGLVPAWRLANSQPQVSLAAGALQTTAAPRMRRLQDLLVGVEVILATVLLVFGGLLLLSFVRLTHVETGYRVDQLLTQGISLILPKYEAPGATTPFIDEVLRMVAALPGVRSVAVTSQVPLHGETWIDDLSAIEAGDDRAPQTANFRFVSPGYQATMGIALERGRFIETTDRDRPVAVLSAKAARILWPNRNPIGQHLHGAGPRKPSLEVVGVVADIKEANLQSDPPAMVYEPYWSIPVNGPNFVIRTSLPPSILAGSIRAIVHAVDAEVPLLAVQSMEEVRDASVAARRFQTDLAVTFALAALMLAALGIFGVVAFTVSRRTQEFGVRLALGAGRAQLVTMVLRQGMQPVLVGLGIGLVVSLLSGRLVASQLYGVVSTDLGILSCVATLLVLVALGACSLPAFRVIRIDPLRALRCE
jgi:predicted permease